MELKKISSYGMASKGKMKDVEKAYMEKLKTKKYSTRDYGYHGIRSDHGQLWVGDEENLKIKSKNRRAIKKRIKSIKPKKMAKETVKTAKEIGKMKRVEELRGSVGKKKKIKIIPPKKEEAVKKAKKIVSKTKYGKKIIGIITKYGKKAAPYAAAGTGVGIAYKAIDKLTDIEKVEAPDLPPKEQEEKKRVNLIMKKKRGNK